MSTPRDKNRQGHGSDINSGATSLSEHFTTWTTYTEHVIYVYNRGRRRLNDELTIVRSKHPLIHNMVIIR